MEGGGTGCPSKACELCGVMACGAPRGAGGRGMHTQRTVRSCVRRRRGAAAREPGSVFLAMLAPRGGGGGWCCGCGRVAAGGRCVARVWGRQGGLCGRAGRQEQRQHGRGGGHSDWAAARGTRAGAPRDGSRAELPSCSRQRRAMRSRGRGPGGASRRHSRAVGAMGRRQGARSGWVLAPPPPAWLGLQRTGPGRARAPAGPSSAEHTGPARGGRACAGAAGRGGGRQGAGVAEHGVGPGGGAAGAVGWGGGERPGRERSRVRRRASRRHGLLRRGTPLRVARAAAGGALGGWPGAGPLQGGGQELRRRGGARELRRRTRDALGLEQALGRGGATRGRARQGAGEWPERKTDRPCAAAGTPRRAARRGAPEHNSRARGRVEQAGGVGGPWRTARELKTE